MTNRLPLRRPGRARQLCRDRADVRARRGHAGSAERYQQLAYPYQTGLGMAAVSASGSGPRSPLRWAEADRGEADPAGANPLAAAPRGRLASLWLRLRWCAAARSPHECQPMAASVHPGELRRKLWLCPGTMHLAVAASFCPTGPFTTIYQDLRDFTRGGARANLSNSTGRVSFQYSTTIGTKRRTTS
jgi:hypothetical protein